MTKSAPAIQQPRPPKPSIEPRGLSTRPAGHYINQSEGWMKKARRGQTDIQGPRFLKIGNKTVTYLREDLDAWLNQFGPGITVLPGKESSSQARSH